MGHAGGEGRPKSASTARSVARKKGGAGGGGGDSLLLRRLLLRLGGAKRWRQILMRASLLLLSHPNSHPLSLPSPL